MSRPAKFILGLSVAIITATTLHYTLSDRYRSMRVGYWGHCGPGQGFSAYGTQQQQQQKAGTPDGKLHSQPQK